MFKLKNQKLSPCIETENILLIKVGKGLIKNADSKQGGDLGCKISDLRHNLACDGLILPCVRVQDDSRLLNHEFVIYLRGLKVFECKNILHFCKNETRDIVSSLKKITRIYADEIFI